LTPSLGVLVDDDHGSLVLADIPGIIEGASRGKGLGLTFLRHIERTRVLLWVIDASSESVENDFETLYSELLTYKREIAERDRIIVLNKIDLVKPADLPEKMAVLLKRREKVILASALDGRGMDDVAQTIMEIEKEKTQ
jgi:GTPase